MTMKIERRCLEQRRAKTKLETRSEGEGSIIQGYAAVYFDQANPENTQYMMWDGYVERILLGAFDEALRNDDVRCLFNHDPSRLLGRSTSSTLKLTADKVGLWYECQCPDTTDGRDVSAMLGRGDVSGSSFSFEEVASEFEEGDDGIWYRNITKVKLYDVGPVTFPAYNGATSEIAKRSLQHAQHEHSRHKRDLKMNLEKQRNRRISILQARHRQDK